MKKIFKAGWVILALGAVLAIVGAAFNGVKAVEFNGFKVQTVKKDTAITKTYAKKNLSVSNLSMARAILSQWS